MLQSQNPFPPGSNVVAYLRDSGGAKQELSTLQQEQVIKQWANDNGINVVRFFIDAARSGAGVVKREAFLEMIGWLEKGQDVVAVVVWSLSRFSRDYNDAQLYLAKIRAKGYQIHSLEENIPPGSVGRIVESLHLLMAEAYRVELAANVKRGQLYVIKAYKSYPSPQVPTGYRRVPFKGGEHRDGSARVLHRLEPDPEKAPLVRKAFQMRAQGASVKEIMAATGLFKNIDSYSAMWRKRLYTGTLVWRDEVIPDFCEPIVDEKTWSIVQEINRENSGGRQGYHHPRAAGSPFLLSGILICGHCGGPMFGTSRRDNKPGVRYRYYTCKGRHKGSSDCRAPRIKAEKLEEEVYNSVEGLLLHPVLLKEAYEKARTGLGERAKEQRARLNTLQEELRTVERRIRNLTFAIADNGPSKALMTQLSELEDQRAQAEARLDDFHRTVDFSLLAFPELDDDQLMDLGRRILERLNAGDFRTKQKIIRAIVRSVTAKIEIGDPKKHIEGNVEIEPSFGVLYIDV